MRPRVVRCRSLCALTATVAIAGATACIAKKSPAEVDEPAEPVPLPRQASELPSRALPKVLPDAPQPPMELTASDGTGLRLVSLKARGIVEGPLAFTELHLVFENPQSRNIEGRFSIDLPPDAALSRFAMKIGPRWQEGEVVERQAARVAYEDFLHRKQDPALLENQAGNRFSARVFPIPAGGRKELIVSYSQELADSGRPYAVMLAGLPKLDSLDVEVAVGDRVVSRKETDVEPDADFEVDLPDSGGPVGLRHGELALARVTAAGAMPPEPVDELTILFDTSASRALGFAGQIRRLADLIESLRRDGDFVLRVVAFDQETSLVYDGSAEGFGIEAMTALYSRRALGASDLAGALRRLAGAGGSRRVLLVSDGIATAGPSELSDLKKAVARLGDSGTERLDAVIDGGLQDRDVLTALTTAGLSRDGLVIDAGVGADEIADRLRRATLSGVALTVPGASFWWPHEVSGLQPGDELLVYARLPHNRAMTVVQQGDDRVETDVDVRPVPKPLLARAMVGAHIEALTHERSALGDDRITAKERLRGEIIDLSTKHRVLSDFTAMLVLETEQDYERFRIKRDALADIMTVGSAGIELRQRTAASLGIPPSTGRSRPAPDPTDVIPQMARSFDPEVAQETQASGDDDKDVWGAMTGTEVGESYGVGGLGLVGKGSGGGGVAGYGRGGGAGFGGRGRRVPMVRQGKATVRGSLDKDIIRRIVRSHLNEVRTCYNRALTRDPTVAGRVVVSFTISATGKVGSSTVGSSTVSDRRMERCVAKAVRGWKFPSATGGGTVIVNYPFVFSPGSSEPPAASHEEQERQREEEQARRDLEQRLAARRREQEEEARRTRQSPYEGKMFDVMEALEQERVDEGLSMALRWREDAPGDVLALVALGEALEAKGRTRAAARVYGSLIDLFPARADLRRFAGNRLERVGRRGIELAVDTYRQAVEQRPDHPNGHRLLAFALLRAGRADEAFEAIAVGIERRYPSGRFRGVDRILQEDAGLIAAAWVVAEPERRDEIYERAAQLDVTVSRTASTRFVMSWETDANDVDFHVRDGDGGHAFYSSPGLPSGGELYADVTTGYGPECFTVPQRPQAYPYQLEAHYYSRGPMGYGMGKLQILQHDGKGGIAFVDRPFVIMKDQAYVDLGVLEGPL